MKDKNQAKEMTHQALLQAEQDLINTIETHNTVLFDELLSVGLLKESPHTLELQTQNSSARCMF